MKIGFIGCVESSRRALTTLIEMTSHDIEIVGVITKSQSKINSDFVDLGPLCKLNAIPFIYEDFKDPSRSMEFMIEVQPDIIYCIGWSHILQKEFLEIAPRGVIGFHPAKLPENRGRHPIIWALVLGLSETASTFFKLNNEADKGPILSQEIVEIFPSDNASCLYDRVLDVADNQIKKFTKELVHGKAVFQSQHNKKSNYWRKRSRKDGIIDWRMRAEDIHNLIRALYHPYPGAEFVIEGEFFNVWESNVSTKKFSINIEPGRVLKIEDESILVKCGNNTALWINKIEPKVTLNVGQCI